MNRRYLTIGFSGTAGGLLVPATSRGKLSVVAPLQLKPWTAGTVIEASSETGGDREKARRQNRYPVSLREADPTDQNFGMLPPMAATTVVVETDLGTIEITLDEERAPKSVANFLHYVDAKHYDGTIFHRVIPGFMAQGGGYDPSYEKRPVKEPVENEADKTRKNTRGTVAMARTSDPHSATAQFFINVSDNGFLDHTAKSGSGWGYTVIGEVASGMDVAEKMVAEQTGAQGPFAKDAPLKPIVIKSARRK